MPNSEKINKGQTGQGQANRDGSCLAWQILLISDEVVNDTKEQ